VPFPVHGPNVKFKRQTVDDASQLRKIIGDAKIGTNATSRIVRRNRTINRRIPIESSVLFADEAFVAGSNPAPFAQLTGPIGGRQAPDV
jgi:hypothetical protein